MEHHQILIIGGGTAGITMAARLKRLSHTLDIAIMDPAEDHYYQPLWTLVGGGEVTKEETGRKEATLIPKGVRWYKTPASEIDPYGQTVKTESGTEVHYNYLVVCPGLQLDWDKIEGLADGLGKYGICSNYSYEHVQYTWEMISNFKGGRALFTHPASPIKCGGAPQKIMYLAEDAFRRTGIRDDSEVMFRSANPSIFPVEKYSRTLDAVIERRDIRTGFKKDLVKIDGPNKKATFKHVETGETETLDYDMIHVVPYMSAPDFIKGSAIADGAGWVDVDASTLQHKKFKNIFSLGDASNLPTSKTGAAIRKQAPVVVSNLHALIKGNAPWRRYDGYTSCPLVTGYGSLVMAEFKYDNVPSETFPFNQAKERRSMYIMKKYGLPAMYWHGMMKGRM
ncbi:FAD/NAD(P)-binding oxidoreductase [Salinicoccus siamensis]|uniref:FAD/NAD(P)-binding oxidoreductase n=1 Tax=Salinicoccus siamensis TaxID=381830 RepID=A0ABV5Z238_9STAP